MTDYAGAHSLFVDESRTFIDANPHFALVLHKTGGTPDLQSLANFFQNDPSMASSHYGVDLDGTIGQFVLEKDGAGANCCLEPGHDSFWPTNINLNLITISIECIDPASDNSTPVPIAQKAALFPLVRSICQRHNIPMRPADSNGGIAGHKSIDPISRARDPGNFPWDELYEYLSGGSTMPGVPQGWTDDGTALHNPHNMFVVRLGFRQHILNATSWSGDDVPLENEHGANPIEESNPSSGGGTRQITRQHLLEFTASKGVYEGNAGQELQFVLNARNSLTTQLAQVQQQLAAANQQITQLQQLITSSAQLSQALTDVQKLEGELQALLTPPSS